jgi:FeS assembly SUF system protein
MSEQLKHIGIRTESPGGSRTQGGHGPKATLEFDDDASLEERAVAVLRQVYDPEIPVNIYDLGLVYALDVDEAEGTIRLDMTLTAPACPVAQTFPGEVEARLRELDGVEEVTVSLVWDPPWTQDRMSEGAKLQLGLL